MKNGFDIDNPFFAFMGAMADILIVNILFLITSVPIITIGASTSAMYETMRKMREGKLASTCKFFIGAFRKSFRKSIPAWMIQLVTGAVLLFDLIYVSGVQITTFWNVAGMAIGCMLLLWMMVACFLIPAAVYKERNIKSALSESLYLSVRNFPYTVVMIMIDSIPIVCLLLGEYFIGLVTPVYLTVGFGTTAYLNTLILEKCKGMIHVQV